MKKIITLFVGLFVCMLCMPVFAACSGEGGTQLESVRFTQKIYEADQYEEFPLTYVVYPSTATGYNVRFNFSGSARMYSYNEETGMFSIRRQDCPEITATVLYGDGENDNDTCIIRLKKYPTNIYFDTSEGTVNQGGIYNLNLKATIDGVEQTIDRSKYDIELKSSAPNILSVSESGLVAVSTGLTGTVTIEARIKKSNGNYLVGGTSDSTVLIARTTLKVVPNVDYAVVALQGQSEFINTSTTYTKTAENTYTTTNTNLNLNILMYAKNGICIDNDLMNLSVLSSSSIAQISKTSNGFQIKFDQNGTACIEIVSDAVDEHGNPTKFIFYIEKTQTEATN